jgi:phenylacetate-CoA ligase
MQGLKAAARTVMARLPYAVGHWDRDYTRHLSHFRALERMGTDEIRQWQFRRVVQLATLAYHHTDFYRELFDSAGVHPSQLRDIPDLKRLPILTKELIRDQVSRMIVRGTPAASLHKSVTSGTSGSPLTIYTNASAAAAERAAICLQWERVGYRPELGRVEFRGSLPADRLTEEFRGDRILRVNINRLDPPYMRDLVATINRCGYHFFHGYPSALDRFARMLELVGLKETLRMPRALLLASEMVYLPQIEQLERTFVDVKVIAHYGQAERVALGAWTPTSRAYHFLPGYAWVEADEAGRIIGSSLVNEVMPLLRYRTTDVAQGFRDEPGDPPHLFPVIESIEGRLEDQLRTPEGTFVSAARITFPFKEGRSYTACKIVQHAADRLELVVEVARPEDEVRMEFAGIIRELATVFGPSMNFDLTLVREIPRLPSGKFKWVESRIPVC